jgi:ribulose-phosphate 3-epimerase
LYTTAAELIETGPWLSAGILAADLLRLGDAIDGLGNAGVGLLHVDVMDGVFCPGTSLGSPVVRALPERFVKDVHLMIADPVERLGEFVDAGAGIVTFHIEATAHAHRGLQQLTGTGVVRGVALKPGTPVASVEPLLDELDLVLLLAVNPGVGGQRFLASTARRVHDLQALVRGREIAVGVDGGVTVDNAEEVAAMGVDLIVAGSAVFGGAGPAANLGVLLPALEAGRREANAQV